MLMNLSIAKASVQNMALFFMWQCENDSKEGWIIFKKHHPDKSYNMKGIGFIAVAPARDLINWTLLGCGECDPNTRLEFGCHYNGWDIFYKLI